MNRTVIRELLLYLPAKIIEGAIGIVMISVYTRGLSTLDYGRLSMVNTFSMTLFLPLCSWLMHSGYRHILDYKTERDIANFNSTVWSSWLLLQVVFLIITTLLYLLLAPFRAWLPLTPLLFIPYSAVQILSAQMAATKRIGYAILLTAGAIALKLCIAVFLMSHMQPLVAIIVAHGMSDLIVFIIAFIGNKLYKKMSGFAIDKMLILQYVHYGLPLMGMALTMAITNLSDRFIIAWQLGESKAGIYQANYAIASATFTFIMIGIMRAVHPNILKSWTIDGKKIDYDIWQGFRLYALLALPSAIGLIALSKQISALIVASAYTEGYKVISWVALGMFMLGCSEYVIKPLELAKATRPIFYGSLIAAITNVSLNLIFIKKYGYEIAAVTTLIAYIVYILFLIIVVKYNYRIYWRALSVLKISLAALVMGVFVWALSKFVTSWLHLFAVIVLGACIYTVSLLLSGEFKHELIYLKNKLTTGGKRNGDKR